MNLTPEFTAFDHRDQWRVINIQREVHPATAAARFVDAEDNLRRVHGEARRKLRFAARNQTGNHIGDGAVIGAKAGVTKDVPPGQRTLGAPATPEREQKRILMTLERLPEMRRELRRIKQYLGLPEEDAA